MLASAQLQALKTYIEATPALAAQPLNDDGAFAIAAALNLSAVPDYWVWRSTLPVDDIYSTTTPPPENTAWSWTIYINRSGAERDGWRELTSSGMLRPTLPNVRQAITDIFSGAGGAAQRTHLLTMGRRLATQAEKLLATGTGSTASPATLGFDGLISYQDVAQARAIP